MKLKIEQHRHTHFLLAYTLVVIILLTPITLFVPTVSCVSQVESMRNVIIGFIGEPDLQLLRDYDVIVLKVYNIIPAVHAIMTQEVIEQLKQDPAIAYITENTQTQVQTLSQTQILEEVDGANWAVRQINATSAWVESTGVGVRVAVLDTGISPVDGVKVYGGYNFVEDNGDTVDRYGHGTMLATIIGMKHSSSSGLMGVAPDAQLYAVKVLDDHGVGNLDQAVLGVQWAVENDMQIISISWCINDKNNALKQALATAYSRGILIVAAAGNVGEIQAGVGCPADYNSTIAVSAIKENTRQLEQACSGEEIELTAPGGDIYAVGLDNKIHSGSGTSFAAAYVTGTAALAWAKNPTLTNIQIRNILCQTATDMQPADGLNRDIYFGYGLINATAAIKATPNNPNINPTNPQNINRPKTNFITITISIVLISIIMITVLLLTTHHHNKNNKNKKTQPTHTIKHFNSPSPTRDEDIFE